MLIAQVEVRLEAVQPGVSGVGVVVAPAEVAGRRVLVGPIDPCGECDVCRRGGAAVCASAKRRDFATATVTAAWRWLVELGDGLDIHGPIAALVAGDVARAYTLYARANLGPRDPIVVVGDDDVARLLLAILRAKELAPVTGTTRDDIAAALVAQDAHRAAASRPWRVLATTPDPRAAELAGPRATLAYLAGPAPDAWAPALAAAAAREVAITGVAGAHPELVLEAAAMVAKGELDLEPMRSRIVIVR